MSKIATIAIAPFLLLLIAAFVGIIVFAIYMAVYKRNINKALQENNRKHVSLPDVPSVIAIILIVVLFFNIFSLKSQLIELQSNMDSFRINTEHDLSNLQDTISDLYNIIKNENSLIENYDYELSNFNTENMTIDLKLNISLKNFTDNTTVSVSINDKVSELKKSLSGKYTGSLNISIFNTTPNVVALISNGDTTQSETLYDVYVEDLWREALPLIKASYTGTPIYKNEKMHLQDDIFISLLNTDKHYFTDAYVEIFVDGKSVKTIDMEYSKKQYEYELTLDEKLDAANNDSIVDIYVIGKDSAGITHKYSVFSGNEYSSIAYVDCEDLYDSDGNRLTHYIEN